MQSDEELSARLSLLENQVSEVRGEVRRNIARAATVFSAMLFLKSFYEFYKNAHRVLRSDGHWQSLTTYGQRWYEEHAPLQLCEAW